ncbi:pyridoxal 5'-phosphate synthase glutaminase subunit PdxT [Patescibacteria group bacterium]|nr:pyridoxal 5'-phosphate synthase glutaminase subunit PdxT [Patescibacteria group bacterium]MBU1673852.1 pyridoxal 5'-phosphate synthase glutaminase subunit PdxT [Patescibacteria group bacterium]MBU1963229.1 pyridoxal 5'-phosphate synthase glutaminase subunit PdxT [Patescibacteria group bacterium]
MIGVLALQGAFAEHVKILDKLGYPHKEVRTKRDLVGVDGLIIPGGESTTIGKLLEWEDLADEIKKRAGKDLAIWGICAGLILIAKEVDSDYSLKLLDVNVKRNAYGRQLHSFTSSLSSKKFNNLEGVFIRAPKIISTGKDVEVLTEYKKEPVLVRQGNILGSTFHPELTEDTRVHEYFYELASS